MERISPKKQGNSDIINHNHMSKYIAGIDIGGTTSVTGLVDENANIVSRKTIATPGWTKPEDFFAELSRIIKDFPQIKNNPESLLGIGIGAPNGNYFRGTIEFAPNLQWKGVVPVVDILSQYFPSLKIVLTNDANAAAIGEMIYGNARGEKDFILITLGTGVGSGIVSDGKLIYGHDGFAGEIGHTVYDPNGRQCGCGRKGCLETYASAGGILKTATELIEQTTTPSILRNKAIGDLTTKDVGEAAQHNDPLALEAFDFTARILAIKLADSVAHTSPSSIYIFGGVAKAGDVLMQPLKKYFEDSLLKIFKNKIQIRLSGLSENDAAILGAAALIQQ